MKIKFFLTLIFVLFAGVLTLSQVNSVNAISSSKLITEPITSPITSATYKIRGKVGFRLLNALHPVAGIIVKALNSNTSEVQTTQTNSLGEYGFFLKQGAYILSVDDTEHIDFNPNQIQVNLNQNLSGINFKGTWH